MNKYIIKPEDTLRINIKRVVTHFYLILKKLILLDILNSKQVWYWHRNKLVQQKRKFGNRLQYLIQYTSQIARGKNSSQGICIEQLAKPFSNNKNKKRPPLNLTPYTKISFRTFKDVNFFLTAELQLLS